MSELLKTIGTSCTCLWISPVFLFYMYMMETAFAQKGQCLKKLKSPSGIVDLERTQKNCQNMLEKVKECSLGFRPHVKTHKTIEGTLLQLGGVHDRIVTSTLSECWFYAKKCTQVKVRKLYQILCSHSISTTIGYHPRYPYYSWEVTRMWADNEKHGKVSYYDWLP